MVIANIKLFVPRYSRYYTLIKIVFNSVTFPNTSLVETILPTTFARVRAEIYRLFVI